MTSDAACWKQPAPALAIATSFLTACATGGSDPGGAVCPPVVAYDQTARDKAAAELEALPEDAALVGIMADYAVMRAQARVCASQGAQAGWVLFRPAWLAGLTMSKSGRDSLHGDGRMDAVGLSHSEMGTIVHLTLPTGQHQDLQLIEIWGCGVWNSSPLGCETVLVKDLDRMVRVSARC